MGTRLNLEGKIVFYDNKEKGRPESVQIKAYYEQNALGLSFHLHSIKLKIIVKKVVVITFFNVMLYNTKQCIKEIIQHFVTIN